MPSIGVAVALLALGGAAAPAWPQQGTDAPRRAAPSVADIESVAASGARQPELIDALTALTEQFQSAGEYTLAGAAVERALDIARINYGLYSLEQTPLIRQLMDIDLARGAQRAAWDREQQLIQLANRNLDDLEAVPILTEVAAKRIGILERHLVGEYPPEVFFGCYYRRQSHAYTSCTSGSLHVASEMLVLEALGYYDDAVDALIRNGRQGSPERLAIEQAALRTVNGFADQIYPPIKYQLGKLYLERILEFHAEHSSLLSQVEALVQLGDWELLYSNYSQAHDLYSRAYRRLVDEDTPRESIAAIFAPPLPVVIPAWEPGWLESGLAPRSAAFIDVEFEINRYGRAKRVDILDSTTNASRAARSGLDRMIATSRFRPRLTDDGVDRNSRVLLRYYGD